MRSLTARRLLLSVGLFVVGATGICADESRPQSTRPVTLRIAGDAGNDLVRGLIGGGTMLKRFDSVAAAIDDAPPGSAVLALADGYPERTTRIAESALTAARRKNLKLYLEYPEAVPGIEFGPPRGVQWERGIVALDDPAIGLAKSRIVSLQDCRFLPVSSRPSLLVLGRVAGFDTAVYGIPENASPLLFRHDNHTLIATTKLSHFVTARLAPTADWVAIWQALLASLDPAGSPHRLMVTPSVRPSYTARDVLPPTAEKD